MAIERRHPSKIPVLVVQCETPYPTLVSPNISNRISLKRRQEFLPESNSQTTDHTDMVQHNNSTSSSCRSYFTIIPLASLDSSQVLPTNLWYNGTEVEITAFPNPEMILPMIIIAKAVFPCAPVCTAPPMHDTTAPTIPAYLLPKRSLSGWDRKT